MFTRNGQKIKIWNIALLFFCSNSSLPAGHQKIRFKLHPGHLTCDFPSPGFMFMMRVFIPLFSSCGGLVCRLGFRSAAMFSEVRWKFEKNKHRLQPNLTKKKKQSFFKEICGWFFF